MVFRLVKGALLLATMAASAWLASNATIGRYTLVEHVSRIWHTDETQELVHGARAQAEPAIERIKRAIRAGLEEAHRQ